MQRLALILLLGGLMSTGIFAMDRQPESKVGLVSTPMADKKLPPLAELLEQSLASHDKRFDPEVGFLSGKGGGPGYHTKTTKDQTVHGTQGSANYAQLLLMRGKPEDVSRASDILSRLVDLQVTDPQSKFYGLWGWFVEEPPEKMAPADWNWADFIGARFADIIKNHSAQLAPELVERMKASLRHASRCIVKRNVGPGYTNICAMGAAVTLAAGEILDDSGLLEYGRKRLASQRAALEQDGGVPEYNSPDYGIILLMELERVLRLVNDPAARDHAEWMRRRMWELTSQQFHPGTGQWAGAQSRAYGGKLRGNLSLFLWLRTGVCPRGTVTSGFSPGSDHLQQSAELACPPEFSTRFARLPADPHETEQVWIKAAGEKPGVILHTWFNDKATLGSVNEETTWVQHRTVTGFWSVGASEIASLKLALLKDGKEFASGLIRSSQMGSKLLAVLGMAQGQGDWHCSIDRPKDGLFTAKDLRLRCSLDASSATVAPLPKGGWSLSVGDYQVALHPGELLFDGQAGRWEEGQHDGGVHVDAVLYTGQPKQFSPEGLKETMAGLGLELLNVQDNPSNAPVQSELSGNLRRWRWAPVEKQISAPVRLGAPRL